jgi:hypothetical protein
LLCGIWLLSVYAFAENAMGILSWCVGKAGHRGEALPEGHGIVSALAAFALGLCMYRFSGCRNVMWWLYRRLLVPVLVAVQVVGAVLTKCNSARKEGGA